MSQIIETVNFEIIKDPSRNIFVYDVTLRDGEQASGFHMFGHEKLRFAKQLAKLGVDGIEAGFAASSNGDFNAIYQIAKEVGTANGPIISSLAMVKKSNIEDAAKSIEPAHKQRIHTFIATSDIHTEKKLRKSKDEITRMSIEAVEHAKKYVDDVEFSCEDFGRSDSNYVVDILTEVIKAGATTVNLPDTVGWLFPHEVSKFADVMKRVKANTPGYNTVFSVHNHNDFGMGTATTVETVLAGAGQVEVTINGIGERAGNTALEEVVAAIKTRGFADFNINTEYIGETSRMLSEITGIKPTPNKAIVGANAFAHEAGIHQDGVIKSNDTYETMIPKDFGVTSKITFGPRSGRNALKSEYNRLGIALEEEAFQTASEKFTEIADGLKEVDDADIYHSVTGKKPLKDKFEFSFYKPINMGDTYGMVVEIKVDGELFREYAEGNGQFDAAVKAINNIVKKEYRIGHEYDIHSMGEGSSAIGETKLEIRDNGFKVVGKSQDQDTIRSAIKSYVNACNRMEYVHEAANQFKKERNT